ncbi:MAG: Hsp70 family protein [Candidatus Hodgkinia cicadicola]
MKWHPLHTLGGKWIWLHRIRAQCLILLNQHSRRHENKRCYENGAKHLTTTLTRAKLEELVDDLIEKTLQPCHITRKQSSV